MAKLIKKNAKQIPNINIATKLLNGRIGYSRHVAPLSNEKTKLFVFSVKKVIAFKQRRIKLLTATGPNSGL